MFLVWMDVDRKFHWSNLRSGGLCFFPIFLLPNLKLLGWPWPYFVEIRRPRGERSQYQRGHSPMCLSSGKKFAKLGWEHESDYIHDIVDSVHIYHLSINQPCYLRQVDVLIEFRRDTRQNWRLRGVFGFCSDTEKVEIPSMSQDPKTWRVVTLALAIKLWMLSVLGQNFWYENAVGLDDIRLNCFYLVDNYIYTHNK